MKVTIISILKFELSAQAINGLSEIIYMKVTVYDEQKFYTILKNIILQYLLYYIVSPSNTIGYIVILQYTYIYIAKGKNKMF